MYDAELQPFNDPASKASRFRRARTRLVAELIEKTFAAEGRCRIIDLGGEPDYWRLFDRALLERCRVQITSVNIQGFISRDPMIHSIEGDACDLSQFVDGSFDLVHSNSVIEHVGDWARMTAFAAEVRRLAPRYYVQTPYWGFPYEPHFGSWFFHWRSEQSRAKAMLKRQHGYEKKAADMGEAMATVQSARLLDKAQFRFLFSDARFPDERIAGLTKSLIAIRS
ncbi:class I SAM-dependent methyltransferase [Caulobacter sp. NIBR2454]|uniref:class I SAM-dependent methyltransferase n=1 Tax=Caulobacter sp. NIBR2454 TaxID=3015996 RepID=UPI0022B6C542|nr:class I SAM-dependent methyltransferase [Caulobacter sp. NIBR2454]